jgi:ANTAR domain
MFRASSSTAYRAGIRSVTDDDVECSCDLRQESSELRPARRPSDPVGVNLASHPLRVATHVESSSRRAVAPCSRAPRGLRHRLDVRFKSYEIHQIECRYPAPGVSAPCQETPAPPVVARRRWGDDVAVPTTNGATPISARVIQASGMVSAQASCTPDEAMVLMQTRARETHVTLDQVATRVLDRTMRFDE